MVCSSNGLLSLSVLTGGGAFGSHRSGGRPSCCCTRTSRRLYYLPFQWETWPLYSMYWNHGNCSSSSFWKPGEIPHQGVECSSKVHQGAHRWGSLRKPQVRGQPFPLLHPDGSQRRHMHLHLCFTQPKSAANAAACCPRPFLSGMLTGGGASRSHRSGGRPSHCCTQAPARLTPKVIGRYHKNHKKMYTQTGTVPH